MTKDRDSFERRTHRRSPGRQYDYDPLRSNRGGMSQSGRSKSSQTGAPPNRTTIQFAQSRPDPRRTRQLIRQSIIANKSRSASAPLHEHNPEEYEDEQQASSAVQTDTEQDMYDEQYVEPEENVEYGTHYRTRNNRMLPPQPFIETGEEGESETDDWNEMDDVDPDAGYVDPRDQRLSPAQELPAPHYAAPPRRYSRNYRREAAPIYEEDIAEEEEYTPPARRKSKKQGLSRRKLLIGLGLAAAGGIAAYEAAPRIPQALNDVGTNIEHQLEDAYNKGLAAGANEVRKDFITTLDNLEGYSLDAAIGAAKLTRLAYDAFVSPLVTLAATVTGDFLNATLLALKNARGFLAKFNQDSDTMAALQTVLETWIKQVHEVPKEIQSITASDLDGAQSYLRGVQNKLKEEKAKLNGQVTPTPTSTGKRS